MTPLTEPRPNARERVLGAELVTEIFLLGDEIFANGRELDAAIEKLCVKALASYREELLSPMTCAWKGCGAPVAPGAGSFSEDTGKCYPVCAEHEGRLLSPEQRKDRANGHPG